MRIGYVADPVVLSPRATIADVDSIKRSKGFSSVLVTEDGQLGSRLLGVVTNRDTDFVADRTTELAEARTPGSTMNTVCSLLLTVLFLLLVIETLQPPEGVRFVSVKRLVIHRILMALSYSRTGRLSRPPDACFKIYFLQ